MAGHVFVVGGRFEALVTDVVVVTTDAEFRLEPHWHPVIGEQDPATLRPTDWGRSGRPFGAAQGRPDLWFLDVTQNDGSAERLVRALEDTLDAVAASGLTASAGRALPLVAVPVPGVGGGGLREQAGAVVDGLMRSLGRTVERHDLDVAVVATSEAQYAALQRGRRTSSTPAWDLGEELLGTAAGIGRAAAEGRLTLFLGAGVSIPAGLPSWSGLVDEMRQRAVAKGTELSTADFESMDLLDRTELLQTLLGDELEEHVTRRFQETVPALSHALLASLRCEAAITTNYDRCYEAAVEARDPSCRLRVMPWERPEAGRPWLLKLHGDVRHPGSVVLTRGEFFAYDSHWRPVGSVFQALMMTRQLLVVGASLSDDNVLRLAHEVRALRKEHDIDPWLGHVLTLGSPPLRARLWEGELDWLGFTGDTPEQQARRLEIFLDAVAAYACDTTPYLLHPHFQDLLNEDEESALADDARRLARAVDAAVGKGKLRQDAGWSALLSSLTRMGALGDQPPAGLDG